MAMALVEEGYHKNTGEWAGKAGRMWKQRTEGRVTAAERDRQKEPRLNLNGFKTKDQLIRLGRAHHGQSESMAFENFLPIFISSRFQLHLLQTI